MSSRDSKLSQYSNKIIDVRRAEASSLDAMIICKRINETKNEEEITTINENQDSYNFERDKNDVVNISGMTAAKKSDGVKSVIESSVENELEKVKSYLMEWLEDHDYFEDEDVNDGTPFAEMGLSSIDSVTLSEDVKNALGVELDATVAWQYPNVRRLSKYIAELRQKNTRENSNGNGNGERKSSEVVSCKTPTICTVMEDISLHEAAVALKELIFGTNTKKESVEAK